MPTRLRECYQDEPGQPHSAWKNIKSAPQIEGGHCSVRLRIVHVTVLSGSGFPTAPQGHEHRVTTLAPIPADPRRMAQRSAEPLGENPAEASQNPSFAPRVVMLWNFRKDRGKLFYLQLELFCLQLSFFAYSPLRPLLDALAHCKQKKLQL